MPEPTPEKLAEINEQFQSSVLMNRGGSYLKTENGMAVINISDSVFQGLLNRLGASEKPHSQVVKFRAHEGRLVTHLGEADDIDTLTQVDDCLRLFSGAVEDHVLKRALQYVAAENDLIKHEWAVNLPSVNMWAYLSYPVIREVGNALVTRNLFSDNVSFATSAREFMIMPPLPFAELVEHYFKTKSQKLTKILGKMIISGNDVERITVNYPEGDKYNALKNLMGDKLIANRKKVLEKFDDGSYLVEGTPCIRNDFLTAGTWMTEVFALDLIQEFFEYIGSEKFRSEISQTKAMKYGQPIPMLPYVSVSTLDLFKQLPQRRALEWYKSMMRGDPGAHHLNDLATMINTYKDPANIPEVLRSYHPNGMKIPKAKTIKEAHDIVAKWDNKIRMEKAKAPISYGHHEELVDGQLLYIDEYDRKPLPYDSVLDPDGFYEKREKIGTACYMIRLPRNTVELITWGQELHNCIASFSESATNKNCTLACLFKLTGGTGMELFGAIEVRWHELQVGHADDLFGNRNHNMGWRPGNEWKVPTLSESQRYVPKVQQCVEDSNRPVQKELFQAVERAFEEAHQAALSGDTVANRRAKMGFQVPEFHDNTLMDYGTKVDNQFNPDGENNG